MSATEPASSAASVATAAPVFAPQALAPRLLRLAMDSLSQADQQEMRDTLVERARNARSGGDNDETVSPLTVTLRFFVDDRQRLLVNDVRMEEPTFTEEQWEDLAAYGWEDRPEWSWASVHWCTEGDRSPTTLSFDARHHDGTVRIARFVSAVPEFANRSVGRTPSPTRLTPDQTALSTAWESALQEVWTLAQASKPPNEATGWALS